MMKYFLYSIISGLLMGLGNIILKFLLEHNELLLIVLQPIFWLTVILGFLAFILGQIALRNLKSSNYSLLLIVTTTVVSLLGGNFLGEVINIYESIGVILMILSVSIILLNK